MSYSVRASNSFVPIALTASAVVVGVCSVCTAFLINCRPGGPAPAHGPAPATSGAVDGGHAPMVLTRWDAGKAPTPHNLVLMQRTLAQQLEEGGQGSFAPEVVENINRRLAWAERVCAGAWAPPSTITGDGGGSGGGDDRCKGSAAANGSAAQVVARCVQNWHALTWPDTATVLLLAAASASGSVCCYLAGRYAGAAAPQRTF